MLGEQTLQTALHMLKAIDWSVEKQLANGDLVQSKESDGKKIFKLTVSSKMCPFYLWIIFISFLILGHSRPGP